MIPLFCLSLSQQLVCILQNNSSKEEVSYQWITSVYSKLFSPFFMI